jgi:hypothetical protein
MPIEEVNYRLDTRPYFDLGLDYRINLILPDSVQAKMINALQRILPQHFADSVFALSETDIKNIEEYAWRRCVNDTICFEKTFTERYVMNLQSIKDRFHNRCHAISLILASANWNVIGAIPFLEKELQNQSCENNHRSIEMALAKLGNDSIKESLIERFTLPYILRTTELDTINNNYLYRGRNLTTNLFNEGIQVAMFLRSKDIIFNLLDLIYIRGRNEEPDFGTYSTVVWFLSNLSMFHFQNYPNIEVLWEISDAYILAIEDLENKRRNRSEERELERLLSTEHRTQVKNQIRDWIIENVNFE